jgi:hypothetical protein
MKIVLSELKQLLLYEKYVYIFSEMELCLA